MKLAQTTLSILLGVGLIVLPTFSVYAQQFRNLDFSEACDSSKTGLCGWDLSWGGANTCRRDLIDNNPCLTIANTKDGAVGFAEQAVAASPGLMVLRLSARISTDEVVGKGAGLNVGVYDSSGTLLFTKDMGYAAFGWIHGTTTWQEYEISALCPPGTATIKLGAILYGSGAAHFDDYRAELSAVEGRSPSPLARAYVVSACDSILAHSLVRDSLNIDSLKQMALAIAGPAEREADCHLAVEFLISSLRNYGDDHSFLMTPREVNDWQQDGGASVDIEFPGGRTVDSCGYVLVPPFHSGNKTLIQAYCDSLQAILAQLDGSGIVGWIIDLRQNTGGNMEPMLAGLGPIFDSEKVGSLVDVEGRTESWYYRDGSYCWEDEPLVRATAPITLTARRPIAVLIGPQTGSSGEAVAISLIGNKRIRTFGEPTWGLTTGNGAFDLSDGARIMLASTIMADRHGRLYRSRIEPDELIEARESDKDDPVLARAVGWLHGK